MDINVGWTGADCSAGKTMPEEHSLGDATAGAAGDIGTSGAAVAIMGVSRSPPNGAGSETPGTTCCLGTAGKFDCPLQGAEMTCCLGMPGEVEYSFEGAVLPQAAAFCGVHCIIPFCGDHCTDMDTPNCTAVDTPTGSIGAITKCSCKLGMARAGDFCGALPARLVLELPTLWTLPGKSIAPPGVIKTNGLQVAPVGVGVVKAGGRGLQLERWNSKHPDSPRLSVGVPGCCNSRRPGC
mmetsp:Transcript_82788/g.146244  ORF Transcript_82788/g.146244 Transcript_82788/m.146244 type:complete len:238 (+) Transcript_82788:231-944(+)